MRPRLLLASPLLAASLALSTAAHAQPEPPAPAQPPAPPRPVLVPPRLVSDPVVEYPAGAKGDAEVILIVTLNADGTVRSAKPREPNEPFSSLAAEKALGWQFEPATRDGVKIASVIKIAVVFKQPPPEPPAPEQAPSPQASAPAEPPRGPPPKPRVSEVVIVGDRVEPGRSATLSRAEVREIPGTFGDPFRAIEVMPGVTPIISGLPFFYVRGAPPGNVGYFLDGIRVPLLFHIGIGPSVVHPGLIERVDLYPGGYPARYGRFAGGIVAGETEKPRPELHGEANVRIFDAGALVEAPFAEGKGTALVGGRYSYTAAIISLAAPGVALDYWDYQGRVSYDLTPRDRVSTFFFGSYDYLGQKQDGVTKTLFGTEFHRVDLRYDHALGNEGTTRLAVMLGVDLTRLDEGRFLRDRILSVRNETTYKLSEEATLRTGIDSTLDVYDVDLAGVEGDSPRPAAFFPTRNDLSAGVRADVVLKPTKVLEVTPGLRVDLYGSGGATAIGVDPRLSSRLALADKVHLLTAAGIAHQPPAFAIPVPGFQPGGLKGGLQMALQQSAGVEVDLPEATTATATVFHNGFFNMSDALSSTPREVGGCPPGSFPDGSLGGDRGSGASGGRGGGQASCPRPSFRPGVLGGDGTAGNRAQGEAQATRVFETRTLGAAYGLELLLKRKLTRSLGGFASYTLSRSTRSVGNQTFIANFDRTHVFNLALAYSLGRNWRAGSRLMYYTGLPAAPDPTQPDGGPSRLPSFYRIDLRIEKKWHFSHGISLSFVAEWMNVTLRKEAISTSCTLSGCTTQEIGPVTIPSIGLEGAF